MIWKTGRDQLQVCNRFGWENFRDPWDSFPITLHDFWTWGLSHPTSHGARTALAEFLVNRILGALSSGAPGSGIDLVTRSGLKVKLETAAAYKSWPVERRAAALYAIAPTLVYDTAAGRLSRTWTRPADIYVFALLLLGDREVVNPTDLGQWSFHVVSTRAIDSLEHGAPVLSHGTLEARSRSSPGTWRGPVIYRNLRMEVEGLGIALAR